MVSMVKKMDKLLKSDKQPKMPRMGDIIEGKVIDIGTGTVYLDLGAIGTGIVMGPELYDGLNTLDKIKIGDKVAGTVLDLENEDGYIELSFREAGQEKVWQDLENILEKDKIIKVPILDANKGGLIIEINKIIGFLPVSQLSMEHYPRVEEADKGQILSHLKSFIGKKFKVKLISLNQENEKLIVSEKAAQADDLQEILASLKIGDIVEGEISGLTDFGAFVKFKSSKSDKKAEGLIHISELAWQRIEDPSEIVKVGEKIKAKIISLENNRISLSLKKLQEDPWDEVKKNYEKGQELKGKVIKVDHFGAFVQVNKDIHGLAHISQFSEGINLKIGKQYKFKINSLEPKEHRMGLELVSK